MSKKRSTSSKAKLDGYELEEKTEQIAEHPTVQASIAKPKAGRSKKDGDEKDSRLEGETSQGGQTGKSLAPAQSQVGRPGFEQTQAAKNSWSRRKLAKKGRRRKGRNQKLEWTEKVVWGRPTQVSLKASWQTPTLK